MCVELLSHISPSHPLGYEYKLITNNNLYSPRYGTYWWITIGDSIENLPSLKYISKIYKEFIS